MEKTMLDFLNEVAIEKGFNSWYAIYHLDNYNLCNSIPQDAAKRYANQQLNETPEEYPSKEIKTRNK